MTYPTRLTLKLLQAEHPTYTAMKSHLERIYLLTAGGWRLRDRLPEFLKQRPGEEDAIYETRLDKFSYSNVLGGALSQLASKITNGTVHLSNVPPAADIFWQSFRENNNGQGRTEIQLVEQLFAEALKYKVVYCHVDKPKSPVTPLNRAQEEALGLTPHVVLYPAVQITNWGEIEGKLTWLKVFQIIDDTSNPLAPPLKQARWTFIDGQYIARYESYVKLGSNGRIVELLDAQGKPLPPTGQPEQTIPLTSLVQHGFGALPVTRLELPDDKWSSDQAVSKAEESLRLECHRYDLLTAAYLQRTYKPIQTPDGDLPNTFVGDGDNSIPTGLQYVLELDKFEWAEPRGDIVIHIDKALERAEKQIRTILGVGGAYVQESKVESGAAKEMDFEIEDQRLKSYGHILTDALQDIYQLVAKAQGQDGSPLAVSGLDEFGNNRLDDLLDSLTKLLLIDMAQLQNSLTPTLFVLVRERLLGFLMSNLTPEQKEAIQQELRVVPVEVSVEPDEE
ncbi:hypothetical protein [Pseudanabaena sp. FACHB-2040]|uniref:hypothetical protein n=1 Tax=Pseudanabaena sp. FACHB-2040 TaxID=2692859 RepID=UPI001684E419|nr:hypothetical protein [Pseudanabaena sp. FACHB-2040]MBD2256665.1 hypothetical protein [Pseudanabaena sp. FACHB-2040]